MSDKPRCYGESSLLRRTHVFPQPDEMFDLLQAPNEELLKFGIIPRPDETLQPEFYREWLGLFGPTEDGRPVTFVAPLLHEVLAPWQLNTRPEKPASASGASVSRTERSANWSGAYIVPTDDTMVVIVGGEWTLPDLALPPPEHQVANANQYVCSTWVGLDGQRHYLNSSLPQTGVMQTLAVSPHAPPQASAQAFFQWWDMEQTCHTFLIFLGLPVQSGDLMRGAVWALDATTVIAYLRNATTGNLAIVWATSPVVPLPNSPPLQLTISGATAEWILERPTVVCSTDLFPFPAYSETLFRCWAGVAPSAGLPEGFRDLHRGRFIRLYDALPDPMRIEYISIPGRIGDTSVQLQYGDFKDF
jgi:hypothetical protein